VAAFVGVALMAAGAAGAMPAEAPEATIAARASWTVDAALSGGAYRWSLSRGSLRLGLSFEGPPGARGAAGPRLDTPGPIDPSLPALSVGLNLFGPPSPAAHLLERSATAAGLAPFAPSASVGVEWKPAAPSRMFFHQGLGIRLGGDDSLTMRVRKGALAFFIRRDF